MPRKKCGQCLSTSSLDQAGKRLTVWSYSIFVVSLLKGSWFSFSLVVRAFVNWSGGQSVCKLIWIWGLDESSDLFIMSVKGFAHWTQKCFFLVIVIKTKWEKKPKWELLMITQLLSKTSVDQTTVISCPLCFLLITLPILYLMGSCSHLTPPPQNPPILPEMSQFQL